MYQQLRHQVSRIQADGDLQGRLLAGLVVLVALGLRLYRITTVPGGISGDELFNAIDSWRVGKEHWPIFFEGNNGREALFLYLVAASQHLFGQTIFALRLPAVLLGTGSVLLGYLLGRLHFNRRVGLLAAGLMAVSLWPLMESRWSLRAVSLTFFTALTIYLFSRAYRDQRRRDWVLGGIALGLTMYTYIPSRIFPAVILGWFGWLFWRQRERARQSWRNMALSLLVGLIVFAPYGYTMWQHPDKVNQRIGGLSIALERAIEGEPAALVESIGGVLKMFSFDGDDEWRYHVSDKPVFDPITSIFFYVGILVCLIGDWRLEIRDWKARPSPLFILWAGAMLVPNAILEANSSFLRAAGAIVPVHLITAIGFDALYLWLAQKWPALIRRLLLPALVVVGLALTLADTWHSYFTIWHNNGDVRRIYQADMAMIGRFLNEQPPPPGTRVFIADSYVFDLAPKTFAFYSDYPVDWFNAGTSFVLDRPDHTGEIWYFVAVNESLPPAIVPALALETATTTYLFGNGDPAFSLYRRRPAQLAWPSQNEMDVSFVDGPQLSGYDLPAMLYRGDTVSLFTHWQIPADQPRLPNQLTSVQARLEDAQGNVWARNSSLMGYPQAHWRASDRFVHVLELEIPEGMPPGSAYLRFDLHDFDGDLYNIVGNTAASARVNLSQPLVVRSRPLAGFTPPASMLVLDGTLALREATFSSLMAPGLPIDIALDWVALKAPAADYRVQLQLIQPGASQPFLTQISDIWPGLYPPSQWQAGEPVRSLHRLNVPLDMPTDVNSELRLQLLPPDGNEPLPITQGNNKLADMTLSLRQHIFEPPPIEQSFEAQFGDAIELLGYDLDTSESQPGGEVHLTLYWRALKTPDDHYTVFNHLVGPDGQIHGQFDSPPVGDAWLTATWLPGEIVIDERVIPIRASTPAGRYQLIIGWYDASDGQRLPVVVKGQPQPGDQLVLVDVEIGK
ncbi:MAG TPA: glycosyltransferase family 39 protein [Anaerolineae bacterium]